MDERAAREALASVDAVRARMAGRARWSWGRHAAFGATMGGLVASYALPVPQLFIGLGACMLATAAIAWRDRRRDGFFINGYRAGATRRIALTIAATTVLLLLLGMAFKAEWRWAPLLAGVVAAGAATLGSVAWERAYRREMDGL